MNRICSCVLLSALVVTTARVVGEPGGTHIYATFRGQMETTCRLDQAYRFTVPRGIAVMKVTVPLTRHSTTYGYSSASSQVDIGSTIQAMSQSETTDAYGNAYRVVTFNSPPAGDMVISVATSGIRVTSDLDQPFPDARFPISVSGDVQPYVEATQNIQSNDPKIRALAAKVTSGCTDEAAALHAIALWIRRNITYLRDTQGHNDAYQTVRTGTGKCDGFSNAFACLARAVGIPCRIVTGAMTSSPINYPSTSPVFDSDPTTEMHAWVEVWFPRVGWMPYDPQSTEGYVDSHHIAFQNLPDESSGPHSVDYKGMGGKIHVSTTVAFNYVSDNIGLTPVTHHLLEAPTSMFARTWPYQEPAASN